MLTSLRSTYPDGTAVAAFLTTHGITLTAAQEALTDGAASAAAQEFERAVDRSMLPGSAASLRTFDPPVNRDSVLFCDDLSATPTLVQLAPYGATAETLTLGLDYWLKPDNALAKGEPVTRLQFRRRWTSPLSSALRQSLQITGLWGYAAHLPEDVWLAVCMRAAYGLWSQVTQTATGGLLGWKDEDRSVDYGVERWNSMLATWCGNDGRGGIWGQTIGRYRRLSF